VIVLSRFKRGAQNCYKLAALYSVNYIKGKFTLTSGYKNAGKIDVITPVGYDGAIKKAGGCDKNGRYMDQMDKKGKCC
jgi:hypothetical protein